MAKVADSHQPDPLGRVIALGAEGVYFYDQLIMPPAGCPPLPQVRNPRPGPHPLSLLRLLVHFPTSLNQLCHFPLLRPQTVVPLTPSGAPTDTPTHPDEEGRRRTTGGRPEALAR